MLYKFKNELGAFVFWSNVCGDLHRNGNFDIKDASELSPELQRAYKKLWKETYPVNCYLAQFNGNEGVALELTYDKDYAKDIGISYEELLNIVHEKAIHLSKKYADYDIIFGEDAIHWSDNSVDTVILVIVPWDADENIAKEVATYMDFIGYNISKDSSQTVNEAQLVFDDYRQVIKNFLNETDMVTRKAGRLRDFNKLTPDEEQLHAVIIQCRKQLMAVHNKILNPKNPMPELLEKPDSEA